MRLTAYTDYSFRVLIYLGSQKDRLVTIGEISRSYGISENHLMKIVHNLGKLGYITTMRGRGGGMKLAANPEEINLGQFARQVESDFALADCFDPERRHDCVIAPACRLQQILEEAVRAFLDVLDNCTVADLLRDPAGLNHLFKIETVKKKPS